MTSNASIREQIARTVRINYSNLPIHHKFKKHMDIAPRLKPYDYNGLLQVIQSWFDDKIFKYSVLDHWLEPSVQFYFSNKEVRIEGDYNAFNLKHNGGVCCHLAIKCKHIIDILYPWATVIVVEKLNWNESGGNHFFLLIPELGITQDREYIETNLNFGEPTRFDGLKGQYNLEGTVHVVDPTKSLIGKRLESKCVNYQGPIHSHLSCHIGYIQSVNVLDTTVANTSHYWFAHRFNSEEFGSLSFGYDNSDESIKEPFWKLGQSSYRFNSQELIDKVSELDYEAGVKLSILQRRGIIHE
jgi:hypothetical protein